jgi:GNAT superfamily N-acetyltransferase
MFPPNFKLSPWDSVIFDINTYEIADPTPESLDLAARISGHYTVRADPTVSKESLHEFGFYYCDTLIEPYCTAEKFIAFEAPIVGISQNIELEPLLAICHGAFTHGRFHRDFKLPRDGADRRYDDWLRQLHYSGKVYGLLFHGELVGFIAVDGNRLVLHAITRSLRGRGLAKLLWTPVCRTLFKNGCNELVSSVSATNLAVVNLYASLGFRFRNPVDLYHRLTQ